MRTTTRPSDQRQVSQWYAFAGLTLSAFAIMERRALQDNAKHATLSYVLRHHTRKNRNRQVAGVIAMTGFCSWFAWHILYQPLDEQGFSAPLRKSKNLKESI